MTTPPAPPDLRAWIGREELREDHIDANRAQALAATLDRDARQPPAGALPPPWHWLYFQPLHRQPESGVDGHAARGGFLPPVPLPRRMWAGSRIEFLQPLCIGEAVTRRSTIENVSAKSGRSGELVFVTVRHAFAQGGQSALTEWQDIVYRGDGAAAAPTAAVAVTPESQGFEWQRSLVPDEVLLFRYSALTFNAHRIHYDLPYATQQEGYPALVVHGPLQATLLLDLVQRHAPDAVVTEFRFRGMRPAFCGRRLTLAGQRDGQTVRLIASDDLGHTTMEASAVLGSA